MWGYNRVAYAVVMPNSGCVGGKCKYDFQLGAPVYQCGGGQIVEADQCYAQVEPVSLSDGFACPTGAEPRYVGDGDGGTTICVQKVGPATLVGASRIMGWPGLPLQLVFDQPKVEHTETDRWTDGCPTLEAGGRCSLGTGEVCTDGPSKHSISGVDVDRACWSYERKMSCATDGPADQCGPLAAAGCTLSGTVCAEQDAGGTCLKYNDTYACPGGGPVTTVSNCSQKQYCMGRACFDIGFGSDKDLARSLTMLEAVRQAGVYIDPDQMEVFAGEDNRCRNKLLKNCCYTESGGSGMNNGSMFGGVGSFLVFDVLMDSKNRNFVWAGLKALMTGAGFTGTFSSYGITLAVNGAEFSADAAVLYASSDGSIVVAFDPWSLAITIAVMVIMKMMSCDENEGKLALKRGAKLCHEVGEYCSDDLFFGGCIEHTTSHCCFNSVLARIVNEQGRLQVGKGWGEAEHPNCSGFTIAQLQKLDFSKMDLTEFYASIVPANVNTDAAAGGNAAKVPGCYYGKGKC
jgi:conjugal transfer mating pair stabilization protein TraN